MDKQKQNSIKPKQSMHNSINRLVNGNEMKKTIDIDNKKYENRFNDSIIISNVTTTWIHDQKENSLQDINLTVKRNRLVAIIGSVGAGKASIISIIFQNKIMNTNDKNIIYLFYF